jgi:integration host factor subunit beta
MRQRQARLRRDPRNGNSVAVPARRVVHFKPGKALRESVDRQDQPARSKTPPRPPGLHR